MVDRQPLVRLKNADDAVARHRRTTLAEMDADARRQTAAAHEQARRSSPMRLRSGPAFNWPFSAGNRVSATRVAVRRPRPMASNMSSSDGMAKVFSTSVSLTSASDLPARSSVCSSVVLPRRTNSSRSVDESTDGRARPARDRQTAPVGGRLALGPADDLDHVAVLKRRAHGLQLAVDLDPDGGVPDLGVDGVGEVQRHPAARQGDQRPLGGEDEDLIQIHFELGVLDPVLALPVLDHLNQMAQVQQGSRPPSASMASRSKP